LLQEAFGTGVRQILDEFGGRGAKGLEAILDGAIANGYGEMSFAAARLAVENQGEPFLWGLWASIRQEVFDEISECWSQEGRERTHGPFKGRLANSLSVYPETLNLKVEIRMQPVGTRPLFFVEEAEHQLAIEQRLGITQTRAMDLASFLLHQAGRPCIRRQS
jgi:hypothetical protein